MKKASEKAISVPGANDRQWLNLGDSGEWSVMPKSPKACTALTFAFSAFDCYSIPLWANSADPQIVRQIVAMEIERMAGLSLEPDSSHLAIRNVATDGSSHLVQALVIPDSLPASAEQRSDWEGFTISPLLKHLPEKNLTLWREAGRYVAGFPRSGSLAHFHAFGRGPLSADLFFELSCIYRDLVARGICEQVDGILVYTGEPVLAGLDHLAAPYFDLSVQVRPENDLRLIDVDRLDVTPQQITDFRTLSTRRRRSSSMIAVAIAACVVVIGLALFHLRSIRSENMELSRRIEALSPEAEKIREARDRWDLLKSAVNPDAYPIEIFHQVALLLPEKGIRLNQFRVEGDQVIIRGEASSVPMAITFKADLEKSDGLKQFSWEVPPPQIKGDTAVFVAYGTNREAVPANS